MKVGDKIRKIPISGREQGSTNKIQYCKVKVIMKKLIVVEHEKGYTEAFCKADVVNPQSYKLDVLENGEWRYLRKDDFA